MTTSLISPAFAVLPLLLSCSLSYWYICCLILIVLLYHSLVYLEEHLAFFSAQVLSISSQMKIKLKPHRKKRDQMYFPCRRLVFPSCSKCRNFTSSLFNLQCLADNRLISHFVSLSFWGTSCLSSCAMFSPCFWKWDYFPPLALKPPFVLLSFFQWNSTTSFSCKVLCVLSQLACPLLNCQCESALLMTHQLLVSYFLNFKFSHTSVFCCFLG